MNVSPDFLRKETVALIREIENELESITKFLNEAHDLTSRPDFFTPFLVRRSSLLAAKATAYNTLVLLQTPGSSRPGARRQ